MRVLLDTHVLLWYLSSDPKLSEKAKDIIADKSNNCYFSLASLWEIVIKLDVNKLRLPMPFEKFVVHLTSKDFQILPIQLADLKVLQGLPAYHRDPFDRILIAQAIQENIPVISADQYFNAYAIPIIW
jgi:PIN domain nuclease of toxin-antitoxin system